MIHDAGVRVTIQVTTVAQAEQAAAHGGDVIVAEGDESGGHGGSVATMVLVPPGRGLGAPASGGRGGGIFDGRGPAAALMLGAVGVNIGTRFLATGEARGSDQYKLAILAAASEDVIKFDALNDLLPSPGTQGYGRVLRSVRTPFMDELQAQPELARRATEHLLEVLRMSIQAGNAHEVMPTAGETAGGIYDIVPASEIIQRMVLEAEMALACANLLS